MSRVVAFVFSVGGIVVSLMLGVVWLIVRPSDRGPRRWLISITFLYTLASILAVAGLVSRPLAAGLRPLENVESANATDPIRVIVLIGGGSLTVQGREEKLGVLTVDCAARVLETARLYKALDAPWVISSGGATPGLDLLPESEIMRDALVGLGVPDSKILLESRSLNTHEQALFVAPMLRTLGVDRFVLVTADTHMRRALRTFRTQGLQPIPAISRDPFETVPLWRSLVPSGDGLMVTGLVVHDYLALVYYYIRGWL
jgi:uncharacterized SAM-binding protein YcdF (DUF218 family)